jgi:hypothetical protein
MNQKENQFVVEEYTDTELFDILDLTNPTDRVLEAKILSMIKRYENAKTTQEKKFLQFFEDMYDHFFEDHEEEDEQEEDEQEEDEQEGFMTIGGSTNITFVPADETKDLEVIVEKNVNPGSTKQPEKSDKKNKKDTEKQPTLVDSQVIEYRKGKLNPVLKETIKRVIQLDSQYRDTSVYPSSTDYTINLSDPLIDVVSLRLSSINIPQTWYTIGNQYGSNFFVLTAGSPGISDAENDPFSYKIEINPGNYVLSPGASNDLIQNINNAIADISNQHPDINFGSTALSYNTINGKATFTLDINSIFTETYYELYFPNTSNPFSVDNLRNTTIPGILGFSNNAYTCETIYSNFTAAYLITRQSSTEPISDLQYKNGFVNQQFFSDIIVDDQENGIQGNNYFTIYNYIDTNYSYTGTTNYQSPSNFDTSNNNPAIQILDEIRVSFIDTSGSYPRDYITYKINTALQAATTSNSSFTLEDISFVYTSTSNLVPYGDPLKPYNRMQQYKMTVVLDRTKIHNQANMKQAIVFPPDSTNPPLWYGSNSFFLFDNNISQLNELNNIIPESPISQYSYTITSSPYMILRCMKSYPYYDTSYNNFRIDIPNNSYTLDEYLRLTITEAGLQKLNPIDTNYSENPDYSFTINNNNQKMFYDANLLTTSLQLSMSKNYDQTAYILDLSQCYLHTVLGLPAQINTQDHSKNGVIFDSSFTDPGTYTIDNTNGYFTITPKTTALGLQKIPNQPYVGKLTLDSYPITYPDLPSLQSAIQNSINIIQGTQDANGTPLYGMNLTGTTLSISLDTTDPNNTTLYNISFNYNINNKTTETDYQIEFYDDLSYNESTQTSWNYFLGFSTIGQPAIYQLQYQGQYSEIRSENDIIGIGININANNKNNVFYIKAISSKVGVYSTTNANDIKITIPSKRYTLTQLIKEINRQFDTNPLTKGSTLSTFNDGFAKEHSIFRLNINKIYTAQDYSLTFFNQTQFASCSVGGQGIYSIKTALWDSTVGWLLGFHSYAAYHFSTSASNQENIANYKKYNAYTISMNSMTNQPIVSLTGDATVNVYLFNQFYIILDDYTQNHLNDGVVTVTTADKDVALPSYANRANFKCNPSNGQPAVSLYRSNYGGTIPQLLTQNQLYAATQVLTNQQTNATKSVYSPPPYVKDMFAVIAMKLTSLQVGQSFVEYGGSLQDHDRKYFGPVNIRRITIRLLTDRGNVVDLNGANWSFSIICDQLYSSNRE